MSSAEIRVKWVEGFVSVATAEDHSVVIDRPVSAGGTGAGFRAGELVLVSLGSCLSTTLAAIAQTRNITLQNVEIQVSATTLPNPERYAEFNVRATLAATDQAGQTLNDEELDKLLQLAEKGCFITNTLKAGAKVTTTRVQNAAPTLLAVN